MFFVPLVWIEATGCNDACKAIPHLKCMWKMCRRFSIIFQPYKFDKFGTQLAFYSIIAILEIFESSYHHITNLCFSCDQLYERSCLSVCPCLPDSLNSQMALKWRIVAQSLKRHRRSALLFFKVMSQIPHNTGQNIANFDPNWEIPGWNSNLNSQMTTKLCTELEVV